MFDVRLNGHVVVKDLDIFDRVGHSTAHDEIIPMSIKKGKLSVQGEVSTFTGKLHIEFVKVTRLCWPEPSFPFSLLFPSHVMQLCAGGGEGDSRWGDCFLNYAAALISIFTFSRATMTIRKSVPCTSCKEQ